MPTPQTQTQTQRTEVESQIRNDFSELQKKLDNLKSEIQTETDQTKKQDKEAEIKKMESDLAEMKNKIDILSSLQDEQLQSLKTTLEQYNQLKQDVQWETADLLWEKFETPTTYKLLYGSETWNKLFNIIVSNPKKFESIPWVTSQEKLEYIFSKIRSNVELFLKNKLWNYPEYDKVINNTIAPAFERSMIEMLRDQWNETNISMLKWMNKISLDTNKISLDTFNNLVNWIWDFATNTKWSFNKFNQWINAIDYLSLHNWVLDNPEKSAVLTSPVEFKNYLNDPIFANENFSPYNLMNNNIFKEDENQNFEFWISLQEKQDILNQIWNIQVSDNPKTTSLIVKMINKSENLLKASTWLQKVANSLLDWANALNSVTKIAGIDLMWEITKPLKDRDPLYRIIDFVCKLIWITWWLEWIVKKWRIDRLQLTNEKNRSITNIFKEYQNLAWKWSDISITDANSCSTVLAELTPTDLDKPSTTKWDCLRDVMTDNMDVSLISPAIVKQAIAQNILSWNVEDYLMQEVVTVNWKQQEKISVNATKFTPDDKKKLAQYHIITMRTHLENYDNLKDFYTNIHNTDDLVICMTASLYADKEDVIEWITTKVFLPENYGVVYGWGSGSWNEGWNNDWNENWNNDWSENYSALSDLTPEEKSEMEKLVDQSKTTNTINYLENSTYKKYLNIVERDLNLPRYTLECVCKQESEGMLYSWGHIIWSPQWAQWLFQFLPSTADWYMKNSKLKEKYWKTFSSRTDFLKDPLATAWAAWIYISKDITENSHNLQTALACYNAWFGNYQKRTWEKWNLSSDGFKKLKSETKEYVENITKDILQHNSAALTDDFLTADLSKLLWENTSSWSDNIEQRKGNEIFLWPELLASNKDEIWWLGNSIMNWFQWLDKKTNFPNMDGVVSKSTVTHPNKFTSENDISAYKTSHPGVKSFMFYFGANTTDNNQTISDITKRSKWLEKEWIQPVLCTCIWENNHPHLTDLNKSLIDLWKQNNWPVFDFAKAYNEWKIGLASNKHPTSKWYSLMTGYINEQLNKA